MKEDEVIDVETLDDDDEEEEEEFEVGGNNNVMLLLLLLFMAVVVVVVPTGNVVDKDKLALVFMLVFETGLISFKAVAFFICCCSCIVCDFTQLPSNNNTNTNTCNNFLCMLSTNTMLDVYWCFSFYVAVFFFSRFFIVYLFSFFFQMIYDNLLNFVAIFI